MRLKRYEVLGFKNLTKPVMLDELGPINVIHGENNVGKSNVLQSIDWLFALLANRSSETSADGQTRTLVIQSGSGFHARLRAEGAFNLSSPRPIVWAAKLVIDENDLLRMGIDGPPREIELLASLQDTASEARFSCNWLGLDSVLSYEPLREAIARGFSTSTRTPAYPFALVDTRRRVRQDDEAGADPSIRSIIPDKQALLLYDARESFTPPERARWEAFQRAMAALSGALGGGQILVTFDRHTSRARLLHERDGVRVPVDLLGTGIQQVISLAARITNSDAAILGIEEPELNLRYSLQLTLREVLAALLTSPSGAQQLFLTSHSPAFESGDHFYWMRAGADGPTIERRPIREAGLATASGGDLTVPEGKAMPAYVTTEALTWLPSAVVDDLHLQHGGPVYFHRPTPDGSYQFLTEAQFFALWPDGPYSGNSK